MEPYWVANLNVYQEEQKKTIKKWTKASIETHAINQSPFDSISSITTTTKKIIF